MTRLISGREFLDLFDSFAGSAYRQEARDRYNSPDEHSAVESFRRGQPDTRYLHTRPWLESVRDKTGQGKVFQRVRIVTVPLKDYSRYALWSVQGNLAAGEDIRYLSRDQAVELGLPEHDSWLFDSARVAFLHFDHDDSLLGAELVTDPDVVARHRAWRDIAWRGAVDRDEFARLHDGA
ncbi:DUF6879 family protein [Nonomuraea longicatena]|uniref:DUF6879 domain-containing protein n=1 Tax=Nonomuraea longicatena TaxID=83682 RepID=A0ABN1QMM8_9ACTN